MDARLEHKTGETWPCERKEEDVQRERARPVTFRRQHPSGVVLDAPAVVLDAHKPC